MIRAILIFRLLLAVGLVFIAGPSFSADAPARVLSVVGQAVAVHDGKERLLSKGSDIEVGDEIRTALASNIQIRFTDASIVSLKPESRFAVSVYNFNGHDDGSEKIFLNLLRGGLRTVTGIIGHLHHDSYKVATPTADIGIRGTVWGATYCAADECKNDDGTVAKPGTYGEVKSGAIGVANDTPEVVFGANTAFYVANRASPPQRLLVAPNFVAVGLQTRSTSTNSSSAGSGNFGAPLQAAPSVSGAGLVTAGTDLSGTSSAGSTGTTEVTQSPFVASNNATPSGSSAVLGSEATGQGITGVTGFIAGYTIGTSGADRVQTCNGSCGTGSGTDNVRVTSFSFASSGQVLSWSSSTGPQALTQTAPLANNSQVLAIDSGELFVGQLVGDYRGTTTSGTAFSGPGGFVYIATNSSLVGSQNSSMPSSGSFSFGGPGAFIGLASDAAGHSASFSSFTATFNAGTGAYGFAAVANFASIPGYGPATFNLSGSANLSTGNSGDQTLQATCTGAGCYSAGPAGLWHVGFLSSATTIPATVIYGEVFNGVRNATAGSTVIFVGGLRCVGGRC